MQFEFKIKGDKITPCKEYQMVEGNKGYYRAVFDFGNDPLWEDGGKVCIIENNGKIYSQPIFGNCCDFPEFE